MMTSRSKRAQYSRSWVIRYYAGSGLGVNNWSSQGYAMALINAKRCAVVHIIVEHWHCARIFNRYTGDQVCVLKRTVAGISVGE